MKHCEITTVIGKSAMLIRRDNDKGCIRESVLFTYYEEARG